MKKLALLISLSSYICASQFNIEWHAMQNVYNALKKRPVPPSFVLPIWQSYASSLATLIMGPPNEKFLMHHAICPAMHRAAFGRVTQFELNYVNHFMSVQNKALYNTYHDMCVGGLTLNCPGKQYTANSMGQLFYLGKILEQINYNDIDTFVEFGGGYGNLARITKTLLPETTYIVIDLPELLAIQYLYLKLTMQSPAITVHTDSPAEFTKGHIHLVPVHLVPEINLQATVFASHFALSEASEYTQNLIINKNFFRATLCYLVGQIDSWGSNNSWKMPNHSLIQQALKKNFNTLIWQPYHHFDGPVSNYEAMAQR